MPYFVGLDWASREHAVCVINEHAQIIWRTTIPHTAAGLAELRVLWRCWHDRTSYNPTHHQAAQPLLSTATATA